MQIYAPHSASLTLFQRVLYAVTNNDNQPITPWQYWLGLCTFVGMIFQLLLFSALRVERLSKTLWFGCFYFGSVISIYIGSSLNSIFLVDMSPSFAGITEEFAKAFSAILCIHVFFYQKSNQHFDKMCLFITLCIALGFSSLENSIYFVSYKRLLSIRFNPGHLVFSGIWGRNLGECLRGNISIINWILFGFIPGMCAHALWNSYTHFQSLFLFFFTYIGSFVFFFSYILLKL